VVDVGADENSRRVLKFDPRGRHLPDFWHQVQSTLREKGLSLDYASDITVAQVGGRDRIYILDPQAGRVLSFDPNGRFYHHIESKELRGAIGLVVEGNSLYVGSNVWGGVLRYRLDGTSVGMALGYQGPVAALLFDPLLFDHGTLLVHTGAGIAPIRLEIGGASVEHGFLWGGPFANYSHLREEWHRLRADIETVPSTHFQFFIYASNDPLANPGDPLASTAPWHSGAVDLQEHFRDLEGTSASKDIWLRVPLDTSEAAFRAMIPVKQPYGAPRNEGW